MTSAPQIEQGRSDLTRADRQVGVNVGGAEKTVEAAHVEAADHTLRRREREIQREANGHGGIAGFEVSRVTQAQKGAIGGR